MLGGLAELVRWKDTIGKNRSQAGANAYKKLLVFIVVLQVAKQFLRNG